MGGAGILLTRIQFRWEQTQGFNTLSSPHPIPPLSLNFTGISHSYPVSWERPPRARMESPKEVEEEVGYTGPSLPISSGNKGLQVALKRKISALSRRADSSFRSR